LNSISLARTGILEVEGVQAGGCLVEPVAVAPRVEAEQAADHQPDGRLVRDDHHVLAGVPLDDATDDRQGAGQDVEPALTALRART
jgi:hypothetical protein